MDHLRRSGAETFTLLLAHDLSAIVGKDLSGDACIGNSVRRFTPLLELIRTEIRQRFS
jgi:hypothetical protein